MCSPPLLYHVTKILFFRSIIYCVDLTFRMLFLLTSTSGFTLCPWWTHFYPDWIQFLHSRLAWWQHWHFVVFWQQRSIHTKHPFTLVLGKQSCKYGKIMKFSAYVENRERFPCLNDVSYEAKKKKMRRRYHITWNASSEFSHGLMIYVCTAYWIKHKVRGKTLV